MKKIGIFTICGYNNYGNRLQNYAVEQLLSSFGYEVETILFIKPIRQFLKSIQSKIEFRHLDKEKLSLIKKREERFKLFSENYIHENFVKLFDSSGYSFFATGSDQVWGDPKHARLTHKIFANHKHPAIYHLPYGEPYQRFSISAGTCGDINVFRKACPKYLEHFKNYVKQFAYISVREETGAEVVKMLTSRESVVLLDPTMLVESDLWHSIARKPQWLHDESYIFIYILGKLTKEHQELIYKYTQSYNCRTVYVNNLDYPTEYLTDPAEFVWLIAHAKLVVTDSFHGAAFSIINKTQFIVLSRAESPGGLPDMSGRIKQLQTVFSLRCDGTDTFENIDDILDEERQKAADFLKFLKTGQLLQVSQ